MSFKCKADYLINDTTWGLGLSDVAYHSSNLGQVTLEKVLFHLPFIFPLELSSTHQRRADPQEAEEARSSLSWVWAKWTRCPRSLLCRGLRIRGANWFLIRAAISAVVSCSVCRDRNKEMILCQAVSWLRQREGGGGRGCVERTGQMAAGDLPWLSQIFAR